MYLFSLFLARPVYHLQGWIQWYSGRGAQRGREPLPPLTEHFLGAAPCAKFFTCPSSLSPSNNPMRWLLFQLPPFYR